MIVRPAQSADMARVTAIYRHHVLHGTATFDIEPPDEAYLSGKFAALQRQGFPVMVAERDALIIGYAYAAPFRERAAYAGTCEDSIYVDPAHHRRGAGRALLGAVIDQSRSQGLHEMIAVIGGAEPASIALHASLGFRHAGRLHRVGHKFGRWLDIVMMQRALATP
ncbi:GNAT family N-acetyltransferase [Sphingomonas lacunae]|uniref:GNAT family N-acetyltransferase n=1 Tax=Sphingomonas lacunae TaxID=2698828 RepID=UPI001FE8FFB3|nr:GNAT family N-acetyltransferase [Sphingomonas lacunae]